MPSRSLLGPDVNFFERVEKKIRKRQISVQDLHSLCIYCVTTTNATTTTTTYTTNNNIIILLTRPFDLIWLDCWLQNRQDITFNTHKSVYILNIINMTTKCLSYPCASRRSQVLKWKRKTKLVCQSGKTYHSILLNGIRRFNQGIKVRKHNVVCILILYVHREPLLWLQIDVVTSWRGLNLTYTQVSSEPFSICEHRNIRTRMRNFQSLGNNNHEMRWIFKLGGCSINESDVKKHQI